jgi:hypothetical protein
MKRKLAPIFTAAVIAMLVSASFAHERITIGPKGGRVIYVDSTTIPSVEFVVNKENKAEITLLDKERKPIAPNEQNVVITAGPRASAKKLNVEKQGESFVTTEQLPSGAPYAVIMQVKEKPGSKSMTLRVNYDPTPAKSGKPNYIDDSVNEGSGPSIKVPDTIEGLWAEINQHHGELKDGFKKKTYEALDEVTQAFTVLLKGLPEKSGDKQAAVAPQVDALVKDLTAVAEANAARQLPNAAKLQQRHCCPEEELS